MVKNTVSSLNRKRNGVAQPAFVLVVMTDPAVASVDGYGSYDRGTAMDLWLKSPDGSYSRGVVWPGVTVYPGKSRRCFRKKA